MCPNYISIYFHINYNIKLDFSGTNFLDTFLTISFGNQFLMQIETKTEGYIGSTNENMNNKCKIFSPTPIKDKCLALWDKMMNDDFNSNNEIPRYDSNPEFKFIYHNKILKFGISYGKIEINGYRL